MIGEVAAKVVENTVKAAGEVAKETGKAIGEKSVDITKRLDTAKKVGDNITGVDISKRIVPETVKDTAKELTSQQKTELIKKGMSPGIVDDCKFKDGIYKLKTVNEKFADSIQPGSEVAYTRKTVDLFGLKIEGVFPKFDSLFTTNLPTELLKASDTKQFNHCISQLQNDIKSNPALKKKFSERQLDQIANGKTPSGYTWHHNEEAGKMELVKSDQHAMAKHTGGKALWGGGSTYR